MTRRIGKTLIIDVEPPSECSECHALAECRPYGQKGASICFKCGHKDDAARSRTDKAIAAVLETVDRVFDAG